MPVQDRIYPWLGHARYQEDDPTGVQDLDVLPFRCDDRGRLLVASATADTSAPIETYATATWSGVRGTAGVLVAIYAGSLTSDDYFLQLFDLASGPPTGGATPRHVFPLIGGAVVSVEPLGGLSFGTGIVWAISSTATTYTAIMGDVAHVIAKHRGL